MDSNPTSSCSACGSWWRLPLLLALVLAAIAAVRSWGILDETTSQSKLARPIRAEKAERVSITIEFGAETKPLKNTVPWRAGMTVRELMSSASLASFGQKGRGASAFLTQIKDVKNEGASGRNWTYSVNGVRGDRSFEVFELRPGDQVLWTFGSQE